MLSAIITGLSMELMPVYELKVIKIEFAYFQNGIWYNYREYECGVSCVPIKSRVCDRKCWGRASEQICCVKK